MMTKQNADNEMIESLFAEIRDGEDPVPGDALLSRIMADATSQQRQAHPPIRTAKTHRPGFISQLINAFGGWPALAGMTTAAAAGLWIGIYPPALIDNLASDIWFGSEATIDAEIAADFDSDFDLFLLEG